MEGRAGKTAREIAAHCGGSIRAGQETVRVQGFASLDQAGPSDVSFFGNPRYLPLYKKSHAGIILIPPQCQEPSNATLIEVENPSLAFAQVVQLLTPPEPAPKPGIDPTAVIAETARIDPTARVEAMAVIGENTEVGPRTWIGSHVVIGNGVRIGAECKIYSQTSIREGSLLGDRVILQNGVVVGSDGFGYERIGGQYLKIPQTGTVRIDDDVEIGANTTIDRARFGVTWIQKGSKIDNLVQIAHNVVIGEHCVVVAQAGVSGSSRLENHVTLAGQVGLVGHITIGEGTMVAAQSGVTKDIPPGEVWFGSPAIPLKQAKQQLARIGLLEKLSRRVKELEKKLAELEADRS